MNLPFGAKAYFCAIIDCMKISKQIIFTLIVLCVLAATYRVIPNRPWGFAPQMAMAIFSGALFVNNKKWAFALPLLSMFLSDALYQILYKAGYSAVPGFYKGQLLNYALFVGITVIGFLVHMRKPIQIGLAAIASPFIYFLASNSLVWFGGGGFGRPKTWEGYLLCLNDGVPFLKGGLMATVLFSAVLFGGYAWLTQSKKQTNLA
ncbi:MAG: hypothetical protein EAZ47_02980 [Bacteroidetes bacterium]|nr:MAG: hypothetical protein EAY72_12750 [Bacteroidota bacterium]TAF95766.1 MAG: hypothetical protein EAZ47_02980 [Bacteroidota bacterium]